MADEAKKRDWLPIESNPGVMTRYARKLGLPITLKYYDLLSTEEWALEMIPKPVRGGYTCLSVICWVTSATVLDGGRSTQCSCCSLSNPHLRRIVKTRPPALH
jgi:hypothetical protein